MVNNLDFRALIDKNHAIIFQKRIDVVFIFL